MPSRASLPPLYAITDLGLSGAVSHSELAATLYGAGVRLVQIRDKIMPDALLCDQAAGAARCAGACGGLLIVNDRVDIALAAGAQGVHLGDEDMPADAARRIAGDRLIIGVSTHGEEEALAAAAGPADYIALGPIFASSTKRTGRRLLGPGAVARVRARTDRPLVAIGGITLDTAGELLQAGADSVAVIADLYRDPDIPARIGAFLVALERLRP